ncbi:MAG: hypothetical protein WCT46_02605 [Candidatus Gracilibacteria bacterium]|jgi:hypothetical protein
MKRKIIVILLVTIVLLIGFVGVKMNDQVIVSTVEKPKITYPIDGSVVEGPIVTIKGIGYPYYMVWASVNSDLTCLGFDSYVDQRWGGDFTSKDGYFEFDLIEPCSREVTVFVAQHDGFSSVAPICPAELNSDLNSDPVTFTISGEPSENCLQ